MSSMSRKHSITFEKAYISLKSLRYSSLKNQYNLNIFTIWVFPSMTLRCLFLKNPAPYGQISNSYSSWLISYFQFSLTFYGSHIMSCFPCINEWIFLGSSSFQFWFIVSLNVFCQVDWPCLCIGRKGARGWFTT